MIVFLIILIILFGSNEALAEVSMNGQSGLGETISASMPSSPKLTLNNTMLYNTQSAMNNLLIQHTALGLGIVEGLEFACVANSYHILGDFVRSQLGDMEWSLKYRFPLQTNKLAFGMLLNITHPLTDKTPELYTPCAIGYGRAIPFDKDYEGSSGVHAITS